MIFTTKFKVLIGLICALIVVGGLAFNQLLLAKELNSQSQFDATVMKQDQKIWLQLQKVASAAATVTPKPSPSPKLLAK